jgi:hypothetical protein
MENNLDPQRTETSMNTSTLFLQLMLVLGDHRSKVAGEASELTPTPLSNDVIVAAMEEVADQNPPLRARPMVLGPFLYMFLTLAARKIFSQPPQLQSSIVQASSPDCTR